jgi:hypothetical protein
VFKYNREKRNSVESRMSPAAVTQLVECPAVNRIVTGSSPVGGAVEVTRIRGLVF